MTELKYLIRAYEKLDKAYDLFEEAYDILDKCDEEYGDSECRRFRVWIDSLIYDELGDLVETLKEVIEELEKIITAEEEKQNYWGE